MALSTSSFVIPTGNVALGSFTTTSANIAISAGSNITQILCQNISGSSTVFITASSSPVTATAVTSGQSSNSYPVFSGGAVILTVGQPNSAQTTLYVAGVTASGTANVYITPVA